MAKRSNKRPHRREKNGLGCMWGLINIFDFNNGRSPRRLISTKQNFSKQDCQPTVEKSDPLCFEGICEEADIDEESTTWITHADRQPSVKKLMEEEMSTNHDSESEIKLSDRKARFLTGEDDTGMTKTHKRTCSHELGSIQMTHSSNSKRNSRRGSSWSEEKLSEASRSICQKLKSRVRFSADEESPQFKEHPETTIPNNESCKNELHDPNSVLAKYIQTILDSAEADIDGSNNNTSDPSSDHKIGRTNFFRRKMKPRQRNPEPDSSKTIVILKPGGSSSPPKTEETVPPLNSDENTGHASQFYFSKMKRVFRIALGKGREPVETRTVARPEKEKAGFSSGMGSTAEAEVRINMVAKKHLSHMLKKVNQKGGVFRSSDLKSLAEVLSFPDQLSIPGIDIKKHHSVNPQPGSAFTDSSGRGENDPVWWFKPGKGSSPDHDPSSDSPAAPSCLTDEDGGVKSDTSSSCSSLGNHPHADMVTKSSPSEEQEEDIVMDILAVPRGGSFTFRNGESGYGLNQAEVEKVMQENDGYMSSSETKKMQHVINEEMLPSSSSPPPPCGPSKPPGSKEDDAPEKPEHPSPVSVLHPIYSEDDTTPAKEWPMVGRMQDMFEDRPAPSGLKERVFGYLDEMVKARHIGWEISPFGIRDRPTDRQVYSASVDPDLLSHCVEEVLGCVMGRVLDPAPWGGRGSRVRPEMLAEDVWDGVRWHVVPVVGTPNLEQTVRRDFHRSGWWADHWPPGMESVGAEVGLAIEDDLVEDIICECVGVLV